MPFRFVTILVILEHSFKECVEDVIFIHNPNDLMFIITVSGYILSHFFPFVRILWLLVTVLKVAQNTLISQGEIRH